MFKVSIKDVAAQSGGRQIVGACCGGNLTTQERIMSDWRSPGWISGGLKYEIIFGVKRA